MKQDILDLLHIGENHKIECKLADGGIPDSLWETYSSFANTDGGTILLGVKEHRDSFTINGLDDRKLTRYQKDFWSILNNRVKISKNILLNHHVSVVVIHDKKVLRIDVPAADRHDKPVYIGTDPMKGTFRRNYDEGDWSGNLYDFFYKVINRIDDDIAVPFANRRDNERIDKVAVHEALHEVVANALMHANHYGRRGIVIVKHKKQIKISNPGTLRITKEELLAGGNSDPRNPVLFKLFNRVSVGERAGSGIDKVLSAWKQQNWKEPIFEITYQPERVTVYLEVGQVIYVPELVDLRNQNVIADKSTDVKADITNEEKVMDYIHATGSISTRETMDLCDYKAKSAARKVINKLVDADKIRKIGSGPATKYVIKQ